MAHFSPTLQSVGFTRRGIDPLGGAVGRYYVGGLFEVSHGRGALHEGMKDLEGTKDWLSKDERPLALDTTMSLFEFVGQGGFLPGDRTATISAEPDEVFATLCDFFSESVPSIVKKGSEAFELIAIAFLDYVATEVEVSVITNKKKDASVTLRFRNTAHHDVVRFGQLWSRMIDYLSKQLLVVTSEGSTGHACALLADDWEDEDFLDEFQEDWETCIESALQAITSTQKSTRLEGLQSLAAWAASRPSCRPKIAASLAARQSLVAELLEAPADEAYPLVVALKHSSSQEGAAPDAALRGIVRIISPLLSLELPTIIVHDLCEAYKNLTCFSERWSWPA